MECIKCIILGYISQLKGYERAIKVIERNPNIFLTIAGALRSPIAQKTADYLKEKEKELDNLKVEIKMLKEDEFEKYAKDSDIILLPYWKEVPASGIFSRLLRYFKPIITWNNEEFKDYARNFQACVCVSSVKELEEKILLVHSSPVLRKCLKQGALKLITNRSWEIIARKHLELYNKIGEEYV